jgi:hypothetical protein
VDQEHQEMTKLEVKLNEETNRLANKI